MIDGHRKWFSLMNIFFWGIHNKLCPYCILRSAYDVREIIIYLAQLTLTNCARVAVDNKQVGKLGKLKYQGIKCRVRILPYTSQTPSMLAHAHKKSQSDQ